LLLAEDCPCNPTAFFRGREFAHVHPADDGSFYMVLTLDDCVHVLQQGWRERHPLAARGEIMLNAVMIHALRDDSEIDVVLDITQAALK
jgi:hypothetical protein